MSAADSISIHFSKASAVYDKEAVLQRNLAQELSRKIVLARSPERILDVGCGTGFLTREICQRFPDAQVDAIDIAENMLEEARTVCYPATDISWIAGDAMTFQFQGPYDLVVSSSALQWMLPLETFFRNIVHAVRPEGKFYFCCMLRGTLRELHFLRREVVPSKLPRAELPTEEEVRSALGNVGFVIKEFVQRSYQRTYVSAADFLSRIKAQGFTGGEISTGSLLLTRGELERVLELYESRYRTESEGVFATYQVGFCEARR